MTQRDGRTALARALIDGSFYLTLATADAAGRPWVTPLWYTPAGYREFFWLSSPAARHSRNLAVRPQAAIVIFDSRAPLGAGQGVYLTVTAGRVPESGFTRAAGLVSLRSQAQGGGPIGPDEMRAPATHRLYRAVATESFLLGDNDLRIPVSLGDSSALPPHG